jgi:DNA polymerase elongation subunit (family B)
MSAKTSNPKILFFDIETFPNIAYVWGKYDQNVIDYVQQYCIATFAARWNDGPVFAKALPDYKGYTPGSYDDKAIVEDLWKLFDEADIVVAHNGDDFDIRMTRARFLFHGMKPTAPFKSIDTKKAAKKVGRFNSNALNDLGQLLLGEKKIKTDFDLWKGCINGEQASWNKMVKYNKQDVTLLAKLYYKLRPFMPEHPNFGLFNQDAVCPKCGSNDVQWRGYAQAVTRVYRRFQCNKCGGWGRTAHSVKGKNAEHVNCL